LQKKSKRSKGFASQEVEIMFFVNIITVQSGWILQKIAERVMKIGNIMFEDFRFFVSHYPINQEDVINFYIDVYNCYKGKTKGIDVGFLNAFHEGFDPRAAMSLDFIVFQNSVYQKEMVKLGYPEERTMVFPGIIEIEKFPLRKIRIGIFQRGSHRDKGYEFMYNLPKFIDLRNFRFIFCGRDWDGVVELYKSKGIEVEYYTSEDYDKYVKLYEKIDYLLVPSTGPEGGPIAILEALSQGIPVISSTVGIACSDVEVDYKYKPGNYSELINILKKIEAERINRRKKVLDMNYRTFVSKIVEIFRKLAGDEV